MPIDLDSKQARQSLVSVITSDLDRFGPLLMATLRQDPEAPIAEGELEVVNGGANADNSESQHPIAAVAGEILPEMTLEEDAIEIEATVSVETAVFEEEECALNTPVIEDTVEIAADLASAAVSTLDLDDLNETTPEALLVGGEGASAEVTTEEEAEIPSDECSLLAPDEEPVEEPFEAPDEMIEEVEEVEETVTDPEPEPESDLLDSQEMEVETEEANEIDTQQAPSWIAETPDPFLEEPAKRFLDIIESAETAQPNNSDDLPEFEMPTLPEAAPKKGIAGILSTFIEKIMSVVMRFLPFGKKK